MDDTTKVKYSLGAGAAGPAETMKLRRRYPTIAYLRRARAGMCRGSRSSTWTAGGADGGIARNWRALDAVELIPRYGRTTELPAVGIELFGRPMRRRSASPHGGPRSCGRRRSLPGAGRAAGADSYTLGTVGGMTIEAAAEIAPDVLWFQLYRLAEDGHRVGFDLTCRAHEAGVHVLMLTSMCRCAPRARARSRAASPRVPARSRHGARHRGFARWLMALWRKGNPRFSNLLPYVGGMPRASMRADPEPRRSRDVRTQFHARRLHWEEVARYRDRWKRPWWSRHPASGRRREAVALGVDGLVVSNHGGRQIDALPAAIDALPAIAAGRRRATVLMDSGVRSGVDVARALALGAAAAFAGKAFLWSLGALGEAGRPTRSIS